MNPADDSYRRPAWDRRVEQDVTSAITQRACNKDEAAEMLEAVILGAIFPLSDHDLRDRTIESCTADLVVGYLMSSGEHPAKLLYSIFMGISNGLIAADRAKTHAHRKEEQQ